MMGKIDLNDAVISPFFVLASGVQAGLFSLVLFGVDFSDTLLTFGSGAAAVSITMAKIIAVLAVLVAFASNQPDFDRMGMVESWSAFATIGLVIAPPFSPAIRALLQTSTIAGLVSLIVQAAGFYTLSYLG